MKQKNMSVQFNDLPAEIRLHIFEIAALAEREPRVVKKLSKSEQIYTNTPPPPLLQVCQLSRHVVLSGWIEWPSIPELGEHFWHLRMLFLFDQGEDSSCFCKSNKLRAGFKKLKEVARRMGKTYKSPEIAWDFTPETPSWDGKVEDWYIYRYSRTLQKASDNLIRQCPADNRDSGNLTATKVITVCRVAAALGPDWHLPAEISAKAGHDRNVAVHDKAYAAVLPELRPSRKGLKRTRQDGGVEDSQRLQKIYKTYHLPREKTSTPSAVDVPKHRRRLTPDVGTNKSLSEKHVSTTVEPDLDARRSTKLFAANSSNTKYISTTTDATPELRHRDTAQNSSVKARETLNITHRPSSLGTPNSPHLCSDSNPEFGLFSTLYDGLDDIDFSSFIEGSPPPAVQSPSPEIINGQIELENSIDDVVAFEINTDEERLGVIDPRVVFENQLDDVVNFGITKGEEDLAGICLYDLHHDSSVETRLKDVDTLGRGSGNAAVLDADDAFAEGYLERAVLQDQSLVENQSADSIGIRCNDGKSEFGSGSREVLDSILTGGDPVPLESRDIVEESGNTRREPENPSDHSLVPEPEYEVERFIAERETEEGTELLVQWKHYPEEKDWTWERESSLERDVPDLVTTWKLKRTSDAGDDEDEHAAITVDSIVEKILKKKRLKGVDHYLVVWEGYPLVKDRTWEPCERLSVDVPHIVEGFESKRNRRD